MVQTKACFINTNMCKSECTGDENASLNMQVYEKRQLEIILSKKKCVAPIEDKMNKDCLR